MSKEVSFVAGYDAWVDESAQNKNHGDSGHLKIMAGSGVRRRTYLHFPVAQTLHGKYIISAKLRFMNKGNWSSVPLAIQRVTSRWKEGNITWNDQPSFSSTSYNFTVTANDDTGYHEVDVINIVTDWANGVAAYGLMLSTSTTSSQNMYASEAGGRVAPKLHVIYATPPDPPTELRPSDGIAVSQAAPMFNWKSDKPTKTQVQISTASNFSSNIYDSGLVANTSTEWDTAANASPPTLTDNTTYYWRVQYTDENGIPSGYSAGAQFQRRTLGALNITNPGATTNDVTPTITHTFSGRTQEASYYELWDSPPVGARNLVFKRDWLNTTSLNYTLPENLITSPLHTYTVVLRVRDTFQRRGREYSEDSQDFTWVRDVSQSPVTSLVATTQDGHIRLTWSRSSSPDYFALTIDGVVTQPRILPGDVSTGGTGYALNVYEASPRTAHVLSIEAVVNVGGVLKHSLSNPTVNVTFSPVGIWLMDPENQLEVGIRGDEDATTTFGESSTTFYPIGRRDPVRVVDQIRGLEGSVSGSLYTVGSRTSATEKANLEALAEDPIATRRLMFGWRNIPVQIMNLEISSTPEPEEVYDVSFDFFQVGEWEI